MYTVIVADDEQEIRRSLIRKVDWGSVGFQVIGEAENGAEALELTEKLEPDLLLTDIRMPFISGIELARQVREIRPATQIAFLSGFDDFSYAQQAIQYNIISYLLKPISSSELEKELLKMKEKIDQKFQVFSQPGMRQEHNGEKRVSDTVASGWLWRGTSGRRAQDVDERGNFLRTARRGRAGSLELCGDGHQNPG